MRKQARCRFFASVVGFRAGATLAIALTGLGVQPGFGQDAAGRERECPPLAPVSCEIGRTKACISSLFARAYEACNEKVDREGLVEIGREQGVRPDALINRAMIECRSAYQKNNYCQCFTSLPISTLAYSELEQSQLKAALGGYEEIYGQCGSSLPDFLQLPKRPEEQLYETCKSIAFDLTLLEAEYYNVSNLIEAQNGTLSPDIPRCGYSEIVLESLREALPATGEALGLVAGQQVGFSQLEKDLASPDFLKRVLQRYNAFELGRISATTAVIHLENILECRRLRSKEIATYKAIADSWGSTLSVRLQSLIGEISQKRSEAHQCDGLLADSQN